MTAALPSTARRIAVVGTSGSGKTYVAEALARILDIPYVCNDAIIWRAGWQPTPKDEVLVEVDQATRRGTWTFDGNLDPSPEDQLVLERCDTFVWLDLPRWEVFSSIIRRTVGRAISREPLWHGNRESWRTMFSRDSIIWWSVKTFSLRRPQYQALFSDDRFAGKVRIRLASRHEVRRWLAAVERERARQQATSG
jgi:adenylate kinase family enzyme